MFPHSASGAKSWCKPWTPCCTKLWLILWNSLRAQLYLFCRSTMFPCYVISVWILQPSDAFLTLSTLNFWALPQDPWLSYASACPHPAAPKRIDAGRIPLFPSGGDAADGHCLNTPLSIGWRCTWWTPPELPSRDCITDRVQLVFNYVIKFVYISNFFAGCTQLYIP